MDTIFPGVGRLRFGDPEARTPVAMRHYPPAAAALAALPAPQVCPLSIERIQGRRTARGFVLDIPLGEDEALYGLGLQFHSFQQNGKKKTVRVNSDPPVDTGDTHAPAPFYLSTRGYGVLIDTARYATFYMGCARKADGGAVSQRVMSEPAEMPEEARSAAELYEVAAGGPAAQSVTAEVPHAAGADVYVFWGEGLRQALQRYNLFSGGGCLPPRWGLGVWYRGRSDFSQEQVLELGSLLRDSRVPCDVLGLEPGWQSHAYPCSFVWSEKFPDPSGLIRELMDDGFRINLWTNIFAAPSSPIYPALQPLSGDYTAFDGLVPDLALPETRHTVNALFEREHVALGVSGYKVDECDNSDFIAHSWSFPEAAQFPSGLDGEQMHSLLGGFCQESLDDLFRKHGRRTFGSVRSSNALAAPRPFVLYSDLYDHQDFIRALAGSGLSGLLWSPEVRDAAGSEDLLRRLQTVVFSPQALINGWYIHNPPWRQWDTEKNNAGQLADDWERVEEQCRDILAWRMRLIPYLYAAFARYREEGLPPFRPLVVDHPDDRNVRAIDDQYLMGDLLLVAPMVAGQTARPIYLPTGGWYDFWTGEAVADGWLRDYASPVERIPVFVRDGALLPLAEATLHTGDPRSRELTVRVYGDGRLPLTLWEDDGETFGYEAGDYSRLRLRWDAAAGGGYLERIGSMHPYQYIVRAWEKALPDVS